MLSLMDSLNQGRRGDRPHRSRHGVLGATALAERQSHKPALSLWEVYRKHLQSCVSVPGCSAVELELRVAPCRSGSALLSKDALWWPIQESRAGLMTSAWVSQGPAVTRQACRDGIGPRSNQEVKSVCDDQEHTSPGMGMAAM